MEIKVENLDRVSFDVMFDMIRGKKANIAGVELAEPPASIRINGVTFDFAYEEDDRQCRPIYWHYDRVPNQ